MCVCNGKFTKQFVITYILQNRVLYKLETHTLKPGVAMKIRPCMRNVPKNRISVNLKTNCSKFLVIRDWKFVFVVRVISGGGTEAHFQHLSGIEFCFLLYSNTPTYVHFDLSHPTFTSPDPENQFFTVRCTLS